MIDETTIKIKGGKGGDGLVSFRRERYVPKGGPDGGDGGKGGDIYFLCDDNVHTLSDYARKKEWFAEPGEGGKSKKQHGRDGQDLVLKVPPGTVGRSNNLIIFDFKNIGQDFLAARGGRGGWGNVHFATATRQSPAFARKGEPGEEKTTKLELKLIADVGLIGLPNSGKSTLLSRISNARPKIADYPFTTLEPNLGVAKYKNREFVIADVPGLIEGASKGKGLGDKFLRHIERTKVLVHLLDIGSDDLTRDYRIIRQEIAEWNPELLKKKEIIVLNKADILPRGEPQKIAAKLSKKIKKPILVISAVSGEGIEGLLRALH